MANPANYPLSIIVGDTKTVSVTMQDGSGAAINISGRTYSAQLRPTVDSTTVLATFTCAVVSAVI